MVSIKTLLNGHNQFHQKYFELEPLTFKKLVKDGQSPKTLVIACSDSRVDPSILFNSEPGDIFVIRNVANLVPPFEDDTSTCHGTSAAIEYAVKYLKVENIIILGHSHCGGIKALIKDDGNDHTFIDNWLYIAEDAKNKTLESNENFEDCCTTCEKMAIKTSLKNLRSFPFVEKEINAGNLELHGWYFSLETGLIEHILD